MSNPHTQRVRRLFEEHADHLRGFFRRRIRNTPDAVDLAQEVYLRLLQAGDPRAIRNVEAYLFTVASNLVKEHALLERRRVLRNVEITDPVATAQLVMNDLPPRSRNVLRMVYVEGLSHPQVGTRLGLSKSMIRKIHLQALHECRRRMRRLGAP